MTARNEDLHEDPPPSLKAAALSVLLGFVALFGLSAAAGVVGGMIASHTFFGPWAWQTTVILAAILLVSAGAIWGLLRLKPWKRSGEPVSRATRRARRLLWLSTLVVALGALALIPGTHPVDGKDVPFGVFSNGKEPFSNGPISPGIAIFAIAAWLLGQAINKGWWYVSADEHERRADDVGNLVAWALFMTVTPAWWVAARAGLLPQPNAMVLWLVTVWVAAIGYFWRRNR